MNVLILGSGGREHALAWRMAQDESCQRIYLWPGNGGMTFLGHPSEHKFHEITEEFNRDAFQRNLKDLFIKLVVPGAEKFIYEGVSDWCEAAQVACFAPSKKASDLEHSKLFSKKIMSESGIPTARYKDLTVSFQRGEFDLSEFRRPVIKISGPSLGKGVFVCENQDEAVTTLKKISAAPMEGLEDGIFVEEAVSGKEISLFYACNGEKFIYLGAAQDHKRLLNNDEGPNTGGMGTVSPVSWAHADFLSYATETFLKPTLKTMQGRGTPFKGVLFLGLMVGDDGSYLLEYNVRFGDPETQVLMPLIEGDLTQVLHDLCLGHRPVVGLTLKNKSAVHVVKAAKGYPGTFGAPIEKNKKIHLDLTPDPHSQFFFAGVKRVGGELFTSGGRVLGVTAWGENFHEARDLAYRKMKEISFEGEQYRTDIGAKA